jgi:hypothetical protein
MGISSGGAQLKKTALPDQSAPYFMNVIINKSDTTKNFSGWKSPKSLMKLRYQPIPFEYSQIFQIKRIGSFKISIYFCAPEK